VRLRRLVFAPDNIESQISHAADMASSVMRHRARAATFLLQLSLLSALTTASRISPNDDISLDSSNYDDGLLYPTDTLYSPVDTFDPSDGDFSPEGDGSLEVPEGPEVWGARDKRWQVETACRQCMHHADWLSCRVCYGSRGNVNVLYFGMDKRYADN
jgi:hypothetical protein